MHIALLEVDDNYGFKGLVAACLDFGQAKPAQKRNQPNSNKYLETA